VFKVLKVSVSRVPKELRVSRALKVFLFKVPLATSRVHKERRV
jgi:hypothetical protein